MATHSIGTGGDFSTPQAWEDNIPATLTEQRIGQLKNQEFSGTGSQLDFSAHVTTSSFDIILETETGASFNDNGSVRSNALRYNAANGAGIASTSGTYAYQSTIYFSGFVDHCKIRNIQIKSASSRCIYFNNGIADATRFELKNLICERTSGTSPCIAGPVTHGDNLLCVNHSTAGDGFTFQFQGGITPGVLNASTIVRPSNVTAAGTGITKSYGTHTIVSTIILGFTDDVQATTWDSASNNNATDKSDAGSNLPDNTPDHNVYSVANDTALFEQSSDSGGNQDFRIKSGSAVITAGLLDATNAPSDISKFVRANPPDIGAWEVTAPSAGGKPWLYYDRMQKGF